MNNMKLFLVIFLSFLCLFSCQTVTIKPDGGKHRLSTSPNWSETQSFFFWGLVGEKHINTASICHGASVRQIQTQYSFLNGLLTTITLGIYSPRVAKVWCGQDKSKETTDF